MASTGLGRIVVGHAEAEHVSIDVVSYEPDSWRVTTVEVACGIWRGAFRWQFYKGELNSFGREVEALYTSLTGTATLDSPNLTLKMMGDGRGHVIVEGRAEPEFHAGTYLVFRIALDQTELPSIAAALSAADPL